MSEMKDYCDICGTPRPHWLIKIDGEILCVCVVCYKQLCEAG